MKLSFSGNIFYNIDELMKIIEVSNDTYNKCDDKTMSRLLPEFKSMRLNIIGDNMIYRLHITNMLEDEIIYLGTNLETFRDILCTVELKKMDIDHKYNELFGTFYTGLKKIFYFEQLNELGYSGKYDIFFCKDDESCVKHSVVNAKSVSEDKSKEEMRNEIRDLRLEVEILKDQMKRIILRLEKPPRHPLKK